MRSRRKLEKSEGREMEREPFRLDGERSKHGVYPLTARIRRRPMTLQRTSPLSPSSSLQQIKIRERTRTRAGRGWRWSSMILQGRGGNRSVREVI